MPPCDTVADAWLTLLAARGVDCLFGNPGTEFTAVIEGCARLGDRAPRPILVPHEFTAVAMAHGHAVMSDRPQAVMVHVTVGAANAHGALMDALHLRVPMLFCAGRTPITEQGHPGSREKFIHWAQEAYDQGGMLREAVKWDYELRDVSTLEATVDRALAIAATEPAGPVYLMLPREKLMDPLPGFTFSEKPRMRPATSPGPDPEAVDTAARWLAAAERPLIVANRLEPAATAPLQALAETFGLSVSTPWAHLFTFPARHPMRAADDEIEEADVVLVLDVDVPWCPLPRGPRDSARVVQVGADPLFSRTPMRSHRADLMVTATPRLFLSALHQALEGCCSRSRAEARRAAQAERSARRREALRRRIDGVRVGRPIDPLWVSACLADAWSDDLVVVNELSLPPEPLPLARPRTYFRASPASCLGWGLGAALGIGMAAPDRLPVAVVGDGAYLFANPPVAHWVSRAYDVPFLTILLNNSGMRSIAGAARAHYPDGEAARRQRFAFTDMSPSLDFCKLVESAGGHGERVDDPDALPAAIGRALHAVRTERRQALLDVVTA